MPQSHSETVCNTAWQGPTGRTHRTPTRRLSISALTRSRAAQPPGGMKLAASEDKALVEGCVRHTFYSAEGRTRCLDAGRDHTGAGHGVKKERAYATERRDDACGGSDRAGG